MTFEWSGTKNAALSVLIWFISNLILFSINNLQNVCVAVLTLNATSATTPLAYVSLN